MKKPLALLFIPLLTMSILYLVPGTIRTAHADGLVGLVCIAKSTDTVCPIAAPTLPGPQPSPGQHFLVSIIVNSSAALNGFDITLLVNSGVLQPFGVTIGTFLTGTHDVAKCIGGVNKLGSTPCAPTASGAGTIEYGVAGSVTNAPATGVLFQADYLVVGNTAKSPITFQTGCSTTSVSGGICVTIASGGTIPDPETSQTAKFTNIVTGYFDIIPSTASVQVSKGDQDLNEFATITSLNTFSGTVTLTTFVSPAGPLFSITPNSAAIAPGVDGLSGLNVTVPKTVAPGVYVLNITGTSGTLPSNSVTIQLTVPTPDFTLTPNPMNLFFNVTSSGNSTVTIASVGNFNGTVTLSVKTSDPTHVSAALLNQTLKLSAKGSNATRLTVRASLYGGYSVNVTASSGALSHSISIAVTVLDYILEVPSQVLTVVNGSSAGNGETVSVIVPAPYNVTVHFSPTIFVSLVTDKGTQGPSSGLAVTCSPATVVIVSIGTVKGTGAVGCQVTATALGNYEVTVTAISGVGSRTSVHAITFPVSVIAPGFSLQVSTNVLTVPVSGSTKLNVTIVGNSLGLNGTIAVAMQFSGPGPTINPALVNVTLTRAMQVSMIAASIATSSSTAPGNYNLTITAACKTNSINPSIPCVSTPSTVTVHVLLIVVQTASPHDLSVYSVTPSATSAAVGSNVGISIVVVNNGKVPENATIEAIVADQTIGTMNVTNLLPGANVTVTITWNTSGFSSGAYMVGGKVLAVPGETILSNNLLRYATPVTLTAANSSVFSNSYTLPLIIIAAIVIAAIAVVLILLPRRKTVPAR